MINSINDRVVLNNGTLMPWLGFGVFKVQDGAEAEQAVGCALENGYRSIDTAAVYKNESGVGKALHASGIARDEIFLTTKVWNSDLRAERTRGAFEESLQRLQTDYVDLYLIHWPVKGFYHQAWKVLEELHTEGRIRAIGVSNFMVHHLRDLLTTASVIPAVNQIEFHPWLIQPELLNFCRENGIQVEAWSPLAQAKLLSEPMITAIAGKYAKTPAQIILRWDLQRQVVTIPKSITPARISENAQIFDFELSGDDMRQIDSLDSNKRIGADPDNFSF